MEELCAAAREFLPGGDLQLPEAATARYIGPGGLNQLWQDIASQSQTCESLLVAQTVLKSWSSETLSDADTEAVDCIYDWASNASLPSSIFAVTIDEASQNQLVAIDAEKQKLAQAITVISRLNNLRPIQKAANPFDIFIALASFSSESDPWTTKETHKISIDVLSKFSATTRSDGSLWALLETTLKEKIRPLFTKTRNPAITAEGRKNFHPVPLARFDLTTLDPEAKPWKAFAVYSATVFSWILAQYDSSAISHLERQFSLLIPPILALIDDEHLPHKVRGCTLLTQLLRPIRESQSDILHRTNLCSVFEDAIRPCLLSLPTITPEDDSIRLLGTAYQALHALLTTSYATTNKPELIARQTKTLRDNLIPSFHHISSTSPITTPSSASTLTSFPHPRLSTLLLNEIQGTVTTLGIESTKYLQETIPLIYSTLTNPFGTAHPPLLLAALGVARAVILNAHPRIWRWRTEILGAVCACWLHVVAEGKEIRDGRQRPEDADADDGRLRVLDRLKMELQGVAYLLRLAVESPLRPDAPEKEVLAAGGGGFVKELEELVAADVELRELLLGEVDRTDVRYYGIVNE